MVGKKTKWALIWAEGHEVEIIYTPEGRLQTLLDTQIQYYSQGSYLLLKYELKCFSRRPPYNPVHFGIGPGTSIRKWIFDGNVSYGVS